MKFNKIVANASPIISLANIGQADLLLKITDKLIVPKGVYEEITSHKHSDSASECHSVLSAVALAKEEASEGGLRFLNEDCFLVKKVNN